MPYREIMESLPEYISAKGQEVDLTKEEPQAKRFKASVELTNRIKAEKWIALRALMKPAQVRRLKLKKDAKQRDALEAAKPWLDRSWDRVTERRKSISAKLSRSSRD